MSTTQSQLTFQKRRLQYTLFHKCTQWNVETYGYIVVPRTNQVQVWAGISWKFWICDIQFEELPPCNVHFSKTVPGVLDKYKKFISFLLYWMSKETTLNEALKQINCIKAFQTCRSIFRIKDPQLIRNACEKARQSCQSFWKILNKKKYTTFALYCFAFKLFHLFCH